MKLFYRYPISRLKRQTISLSAHSNSILCRFNSGLPASDASSQNIRAVESEASSPEVQSKHIVEQVQSIGHQFEDVIPHQQRLHESAPTPSTTVDGGAIKEVSGLERMEMTLLTRRIPKNHRAISVTKARIGNIKNHVNSTPDSPPYPRITIGSTLSPLKFDPVFLRDSCSCHRCVDTSTSQKLFETADISATIHGEDVEVDTDGTVRIEWVNDIPGYNDHTSIYTADFLKRNHDLPSRLSLSYNSMPRILWDRDTMTKNTLTVDYESYMNSAPTLHTFLTHLHRYGLAFVRSVPSHIESVSRIAERIGPLRLTFYGPTWDVKSMPSAKNVANTSKHLGFHQDLLYMADPPGLQMLHFIKASSHGGESLFSDAFNTIEKLKGQDDTSIRSLRCFSVTYQYKNDGHWYQYTRPTIESDESSLTWVGRVKSMAKGIIDSKTPGFKRNIKAVNWSPPFQAPFMVDNGGQEFSKEGRSNLRLYLEAARNFKRLAEEETAVFETKIEEGTCVVFDNRRILHARKGFEGQEGERWLRGAYVDTDPFKSRLRMLNEEYGVQI